MSSSSRDNWEKLVAAVLKREQFLQLCHQHSRSPSISNISSYVTSEFSEPILNFSSNSVRPISVSPSPPAQLTNPSIVSKNALGPITRKLFSAWYQRRKPLVDIPEYLEIHLKRVRRFSLRELRVATQNFSNKNLFPYGYNKVYKGRLADGSPVAVKRYIDGELSPNLTAEVRFRREVEINSIAAHRNVLHVLGFCITTKERLLIYPLMVNGSVESCLRDRHESQPPLNWPIRKGIALGAARGLAHLHYECDKKIIHCDIKAANILLDEDLVAVVADFDFAKITDCDNTDASKAVRGTIGHIASEYISTGRCSEKYDVSGYGVFLLEVITGQSAYNLARIANDEDMILVDWVKRILKERKWETMVDPDCGGNYLVQEVEQLMQIVVLCMQVDPERRLKMSEVVRILEVGDGLAEIWELLCNEEQMFR